MIFYFFFFALQCHYIYLVIFIIKLIFFPKNINISNLTQSTEPLLETLPHLKKKKNQQYFNEKLDTNHFNDIWSI